MERKKRETGKTKRSDNFTLRLDPKLKYLAELAARKQRRSLANFIEWALEQSLSQVEIDESKHLTFSDISETLWDIDEADRFVILAIFFPNLLTYEEQLLWKLIQSYSMFYTNYPDDLKSLKDIHLYNLRKYWKLLNEVITGNEPESVLSEADDFERVPF